MEGGKNHRNGYINSEDSEFAMKKQYPDIMQCYFWGAHSFASEIYGVNFEISELILKDALKKAWSFSKKISINS